MSNQEHTNKLISEKSPYLLQHAHNPVDWYPWGDEAFKKARQEDKPVLLSIGYSTCHWCHVMAHESFEDDEVAALINELFVAVKVDREERPDVDAVYMEVCQALTGRGGWPLTAFLTPDKTAFYAGTYFPKQSQHGILGLMDLLPTIAGLWRDEHQKVIAQSAELQRALGERRADAAAGEIGLADVQNAVASLAANFDGVFGGFGPAPKFPSPHTLTFLLRTNTLGNQPNARRMVETTLHAMARGGLYDHIGFGFSRYSTDNRWLVPHFEKMLYDNALLTIAYLEAFQLTGDEFCRRVAEQTLTYVAREMTAPDGAFYSAQDADSDGGEGLYYLLRPDEVESVLGKDDARLFCDWYDITEGGNFEGSNIPNLIKNDGYTDEDERLGALRARMYDWRKTRVKLFKDDKILTAWNALMIAAYATAYRILGKPEYKNAAENAARFITGTMTRPDGRLFVRYRDGEAAGDGYLDDYAFTAWAMLELYAATYDVQYLDVAATFAETMTARFEDKAQGGYFLYPDDAEQLMLRPKQTFDAATPSGNAVAAAVLVRLSRLTADDKWEARAARQLHFLAGDIKAMPAAHCFALSAAMTALYPSTEIVVTAADDDAGDAVRAALSGVFAPNAAVLVKTPDNAARLDARAPFAQAYTIPNEGVRVFVCKNKTCDAPFTALDELTRRLSEKPVPADG